MTDIEKMIAAARACAGTKFHHQGRTPGVGLDCIGLIVVALQAAGRDVRDCLDYGRRPDGVSLIAGLEAHGFARTLDPSPKTPSAFSTLPQGEGDLKETLNNKIKAGDVLVFRYDHQPQHVALTTSADTMIHAFAVAGKVVETVIGDYWKRRLVGVFRERLGVIRLR